MKMKPRISKENHGRGQHRGVCDLQETFRHNWAILHDGWNSCVSKSGQELVKIKLIFNSGSHLLPQAGKARGTQFTCRFMIWAPKGTGNR